MPFASRFGHHTPICASSCRGSVHLSRQSLEKLTESAIIKVALREDLSEVATGCGGLRLHPAGGEGCRLARNRKFASISLQQTVCLSPAAAFKGREPGFPRGFGQLACRPGQQRLAGCFDIASTGGNISVGPYSSTAVRLVVAPGLTRGRSVDL